MLPGSKSRLRTPRVVADDVRICEVPDDLRDLIDDSKFARLQKYFTRFDVDKASAVQSGYIESYELTAILRGMGFNPTDKHVSEILHAYDTDRNQNLSFGEFVEEAKIEGELIRRAFTFFLPNDCQSMSYSDFKEIMTDVGDSLSSDEVDRFFALVDDESDGILRIDEFMKVLYSDKSDLTQISDDPLKDDIRTLFAQSVRPQRRSLAQSHSVHERVGNNKVNMPSVAKALQCGDSWLQKTRGDFGGNEAGRSPSSDNSSMYNRRRSSRYSRCRSLHVASSSLDQRDQGVQPIHCRHSNPVQYLASGLLRPMHPHTRAAHQDKSSTKPSEGFARCSQEQSQSPCGTSEKSCGRNQAHFGHATVPADSSAVGVMVTGSHLPPLISPMRKHAHVAQGPDGRQRSNIDQHTVQAVSSAFSDLEAVRSKEDATLESPSSQ